MTLKTTSQILAPLALLAALALSAAPAQAQLSVALAPVAPVFTSSADQTITFSATLTNSYSYPLYLNGDFFGPPAAPLSTDDTPFNDTFVTSGTPLDAKSVTTADLFTVLVPANTPVNGYDGTFYLTGGSDLLATQAQSSTPFHVDVQAVPEAATPVSFGLLLALGIGGVVVAGRRRKKDGSAKH
jgi:hypothetical protein